MTKSREPRTEPWGMPHMHVRVEEQQYNKTVKHYPSLTTCH